MVLDCGHISTALLQQRMGFSYTRVAALCDQIEALGMHRGRTVGLGDATVHDREYAGSESQSD